MPRLTAIDPASASEQTKTLLDGVQKKMGMTPNLMRTLGHSPAALEAFLAFGSALGKGVLTPKLREQIALTVAELNGCAYCLSAHSALGKMVGLGDEELEDSRRGNSTDRRTEAVLQFARKIVTERGWVSDENVAELRANSVTDEELAEIVANVAHNTFSNYFNHVTQAESDFPAVAPLESAPACSCH
jgi:uncharacterized peroxidase-related enzyme